MAQISNLSRSAKAKWRKGEKGAKQQEEDNPSDRKSQDNLVITEIALRETLLLSNLDNEAIFLHETRFRLMLRIS